MANVAERVRRFLRATGMPPTLFGREAVNDPRLVGDLTNGRQPGAAVTARIDAYIASRMAERE